MQRASQKTKEILSAHYPTYIDPALDAKLRERFDIKLAPADMRAGNGRW